MNDTCTKKRKRKPLLVVLLIILALVTAFIAVPGIYTKTHKDANAKGDMKVSPLNTERLKEIMNVPSDIEGKSRADKMAMGLQASDGSDTDHDGLTDKEEIEVYKSDPLKASTAGDLYFDKEKVDAGLDLYTPVAYPGEPTFAGNPHSAVRLTAKTADDRNAMITDVSGLYESLYSYKSSMYEWVNKYTTYKTYEISNFNGEISIDMTPVLEGHKDLKMGDLTVLISNKGNYNSLNKTKFTTQDNRITPDITSEEGYTFLLVVVNKRAKGMIATIKDNISFMAQDIKKTEVKECDATVVDFTLLSFFRSASTIYYVSSGNKTEDDAVLDRMLIASAEIIDPAPTRDNIKEVTPAKLESIRKMLSLFPSSRITPDHAEVKASHVLLSYFDYADIKGVTANDISEYYSENGGQPLAVQGKR